MVDRNQRLTHIVFDLVTGRVCVAANFASICGIQIAVAEADTAAVLGVLRARIGASVQSRIDSFRHVFLAGATSGEESLSLMGDDGVERRMECFWSIERATDGKPTRAVVCAADMSAAERMHDAIRDLEARHRSALNAGRMGSWETDFVAGTRTWSAEGIALFGLGLAGTEGHVGGPEDEYVRAIHPDDRHLAKQYYAWADAQDSFATEYRIVRPDGATRWLSGRGLVLSRAADGKAQRLVSIMADVTERRAAEEDLRVERERLVLALEAGRMGAFDLDIDHDVLWWSPQMYEVFGVAPDSFVPTRESVGRLIHPADFDEFALRRTEAIAQRHAFELEARIVRPSGEVAWVAHRGHSTYDAAGRPRRSFGVTMDISERKAAEQALRDADRMKDDFIATLAHELRNPLAPIRNAIALLSQNAPVDDAQRSRYRGVLSRQIAQMSRLLDDLLDASRIARGQVRLQRERVDLRSLFEQAIEVAQPWVDAGGHSLEVALPPAAIEVDGDPLRLAQVVSNLLINSAKYTPPQGTIRLSGEREGEKVVLRVTDDGAGIAAGQLGRIFEMFRQADSASLRSQSGLGIGLALARGLVELHGGHIEAQSDGLGKGSTFAVYLPHLNELEHALGPRAQAAPCASPEVADAPLRILVADDSVDNADTMGEILESMGHEVRVAHDGIEALRLAKSFEPDAAILDLGMPGMNGLDVARELRRHDWGATMILICQTGWGQEQYRQESRRAGFDHHLVKPIDFGEVVRLLAPSRDEGRRG